MSLAVVLGFGLALVPATVGAVNVNPIDGACGENVVQSQVCESKNDNVSTTITQVIDVLLFAIGIISVIMIIVGGIFYATSTGDQSRITRGKLTITYAVAGLIVALLAYAIVHFVVDRFQ